jgi:hypothetical protein
LDLGTIWPPSTEFFEVEPIEIISRQVAMNRAIGAPADRCRYLAHHCNRVAPF